MIKGIQYKGYATEPSDYECADGQLATSLNLINEDNQLKPVFQPQDILNMPEGMNILFLHQNAGYKHYIIAGAGQGSVTYYYIDDNDIKDMVKPINGDTIQELMTDIGYSSTSMPLDITAVGNTIVMLMDDGVHYILWNTQQAYIYLGQKPPKIGIAFGLKTKLECWPKNINAHTHAERAECRGMTSRKDIPDMPFVSTENAWVKPKNIMQNYDYSEFHDDYSFSIENRAGENGETASKALAQRWTDFALAQVNRFVAEHATAKGRFVHPFYVRWAYEMNDEAGTLIMHSDPVLLIPNGKHPFFAMDGNYGFELEDAGNQNINYRFRGRAYGFVGELTAKIDATAEVIQTLRSNWKDIIKSINIYVSPPIYTYKQDGKVWGWTNMDEQGAWDKYFTEGDYTFNDIGIHYGRHTVADVFQAWNEDSGNDYEHRYFQAYQPVGIETGSYPLPSYILTMPEPTTEERLKAYTEPIAFYKVAEYQLDDNALDNANTDMTVNIGNDTLGSLLARETMKDDYHSLDSIRAERAFTYNSRLNLSAIQRTIHSPLQAAYAWPRCNSSQRQWKIAVEIQNDEHKSIVVATDTANGTLMPRFVFYPNRKAVNAWVAYSDNNTQYVYKLPLKEHPFLEGAYWFGGADAEPEAELSGENFPAAMNETVNENNKLFTSEVNNPFHFPKLGIKTVGTGTIIGISAAAKALSQGQFGQFPLYAFTTEGVWALEVSSNGSYSARQPITRDVCINPDSITQIDSSVLFATDRGIMLISGSQTQCITDSIFSEAPFNVLDLPGIDQLHTKLGHSADACLPMQPFLKFLAECQMVYDYVHQRIFVYNPTKVNGSPKYTYAYVFSLKSKMWGMVFSDLASTINAYPEALAMTHDNKLVSFSETDEQVCKGLYITRPLKLEAADVQKTITTLIQRGHFQRGDVGTVLYGSRDLYTWHLIWSSKDHYLRGFRGTPYKYFRIAGLATLTDGKSIFGASVNFEPRHTNQLR